MVDKNVPTYSKRDNLNFEVHASLLFQLGDQLITDNITAISELIKNSYDADASYVSINVDPDWVGYDLNNNIIKGKIEIKDNGSGMGIEKIKSGWLTISHSEKRLMKESGLVTKKYQRLPLGDKGLGRLSAQRLGNNLTLITKQKDSLTEFKVDINWDLFKGDVNLSEVSVPVEYTDVDIKDLRKSYTHLIITNLKDLEYWKTNSAINEFEESLAKITTPFEFNRTFIIKAKIGERTLEQPEASKELLNSAPARYEFLVNEKYFEIKGYYRLEFFPGYNKYGNKLNEFIELIKDKSKKYKTYYCGDGFIIFKYHEKVNLYNISGYDEKYHPGCFKGYLYDYILTPDAFKSISMSGGFKEYDNLSDLKKHVKTYGGIKIFRDDFRVLPYGENQSMSFDWIGLSQEYTSGRSYYSLRPGNIVGYIRLTGLENKNLKEKTDREGFVDDGYSRAFFNICKHIVKRINVNREFLRRHYKLYEKQVKASQEAKEEYIPSYKLAKDKILSATDYAENISTKAAEGRVVIQKIDQAFNNSKVQLQNLKLTKSEEEHVGKLIDSLHKMLREIELIFNNLSEDLQKIKKCRSAAISLVQQIELTMNQVQEVMELAGLGLTAETLTHEIFTLINYIKHDAQQSRRYFRSQYDYNVKMESFFDSIIARADALRKQTTHLSPGFRNVRTKKEKIKMGDLIKEHKSYFIGRAKRYDIIINESINKDFYIYANKGVILQIFDNLYSNSEYWLEQTYKNKKIQKKEYNIQILGEGIINVWDNGIGIDPNMEDRIFEPFITSKNEGRGLGLYIISRLLSTYDCLIRLMEPKNQFGNKYKFEIDLSRIQVEG